MDFPTLNPEAPFVVGASNSLENVTFDMTCPGIVLSFAPGVGTFTLGGLLSTNSLALQDSLGGAITLGLGGRNDSVTYAKPFTGPGGLTKNGTGTMTLTNAQNYAGATMISGGTLQLGDGVRDGALTNSASITDNATLAINMVANQTYANPVYGIGTITKAGTGALTLNNFQMHPGTVTLNANAGTVALNGGNSSGVTFTVNSGSALQVNGGSYLMGGFTLNTGSSPLSFTGGSSTGATLVANNGTAVEVTGGTHLFASPLSGNGRNNRYTQSGGTASFITSEGWGNTNLIHAFVSGGTLNIGTAQCRGLGLLASGAAVVRLFGTHRIASDGSSHSWIITNNADVMLSGGNVQLMSGGFASTGTLALAGGTLTVSGLDNAQENPTNRAAVNFDGGLLRFSGSYTVAANPYSVFSVFGNGARIDSGSGANTLSQPLVNGTGGADGGLMKFGAGTLTLTTNEAYTGQTVVKAGTLASTAVVDAPFGNASVVVDSGTLGVTPSGSGQTLSLTAAGGAAGNTVAYGAGPSTLRLARGSNTGITLTLGNSGAAVNSVLVRMNNGVLAISPGAGTATLGNLEKLLINGGVPMVNGMASASLFAIHNDNRTSCDFLTHGGNGFQVASYTAGLGGGVASIANVTTNSTINNTRVYALRVHNGANLTVTGGTTLTVGDGVNPAGVIINNSTNTTAGITGGTLDFGASEGVIIFNLRRSDAYGPTLNSVIAGSNGVTLVGGGPDEDLVLGSAGNTYSGGTRIMAGRVSIANALGFSTGDVSICGNAGWGGQFLFNFAGTVTNAFHLAGVGTTKDGTPAGAVRFDANGILSGPVELMDDTRVGAPSPTVVGTISGSIYGPRALEIGCPGQGWGKILLTGGNTYSGTTLVSGGTLEIGTGGTLGTGPVVNNTVLAFSGSGSVTVTNPISGTGRVVQSGNGTLTLSGANTYSGITEVNSGALVVGNASTNVSTISVNATLDLSGQNLSLGRLAGSGAVSNSVGGALTLTVGAGNADSLFGGAIRDGAGTLALNKTGSGTLALSGLNTYSGATVVGGGTLKLQGVPTAPLSYGLSYRLDASDASTLALSGPSNVAVWADSTAAGVNFTQTVAVLQPVYVTNAINGRGAVRFEGITNRLFSAKSVVAQTLFAVNTVRGYMSGGGFWGQNLSDYGIRQGTSTSWQFPGNVNDFSSGGQMFINGVETNVFVPGAPHILTAVSPSVRNWVTAIGDYWANSGYWRSYKGDVGEVLVYNTVLSKSDRQAVEAYLSYKWLGLGYFSPTNVLPTATALVVSNNAAIDLNGVSQAVGSLSGAGSVLNGSGAWSTLTVGNDNTSTLFSGAISGSNALVKVGSGTLTLSAANTYFGNTLVSGGTLRLSGGANRLPTSSTVTVAAGATLDLNGQSQALAGIGGGGSVIGGSLTVTNGVVAPGGLSIVGTLTLSNTPTLSGTLIVDTRTNGTCDLLSVTGSLDVSGLALQMADAAQMSGLFYTIATCSGDLSGTFASTNLTRSWSVRYDRTPGAGKVILVHKLGTLISIQ